MGRELVPDRLRVRSAAPSIGVDGGEGASLDPKRPFGVEW